MILFGEKFMKCRVCGCENPDDYKFCHDCGSPLSNYNLENIPHVKISSDKLIIIGYIVAILFGWGTFIFNFLFGSFGFFSFIGLVFPGFMLNNKDPKIRKHAYIQLAIMISGIIMTFLVLFRHPFPL
jgi:hypothetical protein